MVALVQLNAVLIALLTTELIECLPEVNDTNEVKHVKTEYVWKRTDGVDLTLKVNKTWINLNETTAKENESSEEAVVESSQAEVGARRKIVLGAKRIDISPHDCGLNENKPRIVSGHASPMGAFPWIAVLVRFGEPFCAGNIINSQWIMSAAHCFMRNNSTEEMFIRIGTDKSNKGLRIKPSKIIMHPRFNIMDNYNSDISLIKIDTPMKFSRHVRPICLPSITYSEPTSKKLLVAGWGAKSFVSSVMPIQLQEVSLNIITGYECFKRIQGKDIIIYKSQICTWTKGKDACKGDSGGPAVEYVKNKAHIVGIVSYGITCADKYPGIFTKVSYFLEWIKKTIDLNTKTKKRVKGKPLERDESRGDAAADVDQGDYEYDDEEDSR